MDFFTSLLKAYEKAEEIGLVDQQKGTNEPVLLPIYHTSLKSDGKNIISVKPHNVQFVRVPSALVVNKLRWMLMLQHDVGLVPR